MNERLTRNIRRYQNYCQFELKKCKYKDIYDFEDYSELEEYVDCDLTLGIDKLGEYEDIDTDPKHLAKIKHALEIIKNKRVDVALFLRVARFNNVETYNCEIVALDRHLTQEEYDLLKEVLL